MDMTAITTPIMRMIPEMVPRINLKSLKHFCQYFFNISSLVPMLWVGMQLRCSASIMGGRTSKMAFPVWRLGTRKIAFPVWRLGTRE
jgi:hypothetical protein